MLTKYVSLLPEQNLNLITLNYKKVNLKVIARIDSFSQQHQCLTTRYLNLIKLGHDILHFTPYNAFPAQIVHTIIVCKVSNPAAKYQESCNRDFYGTKIDFIFQLIGIHIYMQHSLTFKTLSMPHKNIIWSLLFTRKLSTSTSAI